MRIFSLLATAAIVVTATVGCRTTDRSPDHNNFTTQIDSLFDSHFASANPGTPGAIVLIAQGDSVIYNRGIGVADVDSREPITDRTLFNICSISKQFAAVGILKLVEEGRLELDDAITKFMPQLRNPRYKEITLQHLLSHTSGIPDTRPRTEAQWKDYTRRHATTFANNHDYRLYSLTYESTKYLIDNDSFAFAPGTAYKYENPTYQLMLQVIEDVTRERFVDWMNANVFAAAGLKETRYFEPETDNSDLAHAYIPAPPTNPYSHHRSPDGAWQECDYGEADFFPTKADGGIYTSARDFLQWERALMGGRVICDSMVRKAATPIIATGDPHTYYGLGLFIENAPDKPRKVYHTGDNGGFLTVEAYFPEKELFYLVFANRPDWPREKVVAELDSLLASHTLI